MSASTSQPALAGVRLANPNLPQRISAGDGFLCMYDGSSLKCSGLNDQGQLGDGTATNRSYLQSIADTAKVGGPQQLAVGASHVCAVSGFGATPSAGLLYCWGDNQYGQLGDGTTSDKSVPTLVANGGGFINADVQAVAVGNNHTCAVTLVGQTPIKKLFCWGLNNKGQLGDSSTTNRSSATAVSAPFDTTGVLMAPQARMVSGFAAGAEHTCAVADSNPTGVWCWGENSSGQLGNSSTTDSSAPVDTGLTGISAGGNTYHGNIVANQDASCVNEAAVMKCWGGNSVGQMGNGGGADVSTPTAVPDNGSFDNGSVQYIAAGGQSICAITSVSPYTAYKLWCWGLNNTGQLGDGTTSNQNRPTLVADNSASLFTNGDLDKAGGNRMSQGTTLSRSVTGGFGCVTYWCWGKNTYGQLAQNNTTDVVLPKIVQVGTSVEDDATGVVVSAVMTDAGVKVSFSGLPANSLTRVAITIAPRSHVLAPTQATGAGVKTYSATQYSGATLPSVSGNAFTATVATMRTSTIVNGRPSTATEQFVAGASYHLTYSVTGPATTGYPDGWNVQNAAGPEVIVTSSDATSDTTTTTEVVASTSQSTTVVKDAVPGVTKTDTKVYPQAPVKVAAASAINVLTSAQASVMDIQTKTPSVCLPNDDELVFIDEGKCIAEVVNIKTRKVLRTLRTTVVEDEVSELKIGNEVAVLTPLYFSSGTADMKKASLARLGRLKGRISAAGSVLVAGHTGTLTGNTPENQRLSRERAAQTVKELRSRGAKGPFVIASVGALDPASTGKTQAEQDKNRRVVIVLVP